MKKIYFASLLVIILSNGLLAQDYFFWTNGAKVKLKEDKTSQIIYLKKDKELSLKKTSNIKDVKKNSSKRLGSYNIVRYKDLFEKETVFDKDKIKFKQYGLKADNGETLFSTQYIILKLKQDNKIEDFNNIFTQFNVEHYSTNYNVQVLKVSDIKDVFDVADEIYQTGLVEWCRPNFIRKMQQHSEPKDKQYYIHNNHHYCGAFNNDINALEAWEITKGCDDIKVAVIDDGVEDHPELRDASGNSRVLDGYSIPGTTANGRPSSTGDHGQACAGIIAASHSSNIRGIAPNVKIVPVNVDYDVDADELEWFDAINWAWEPDGGNADILSNSWGPTVGASGNELYIEASINAQIYGRGGDFENDIPGLGAIVVFSSGNNAEQEGVDEVNDYAKSAIAVGAIDKTNEITDYSQYGPNQDLVAYGGYSDIRTIDRTGDNGYGDGNYTDSFGGTSAACPQVSGAAALILSINPNLTREEVENLLFSTATDLGDSGKDDTYGHGRLNVYEACKKAVKTRDMNFILTEEYLSYSKIEENERVTFVTSPGCGVPPALYFCDIYKAVATIPYNSLYIGDGLSGANPNSGEYYVNYSDNGESLDVLTFFYYVRNASGGSEINKWVPHNPSNSWSRKYLMEPEENKTFNGVVNSGETNDILATNSITLQTGFYAHEGADFSAVVSVTSEDIVCLENPNKSILINSNHDEVNVIFDNYKDEIDDEKNEYQLSENIVKKTVFRYNIYPNPNNGNFNIDIEGNDKPVKVEVSNALGGIVLRKTITGTLQIDISNHPDGIYFVKTTIGEEVFIEKIIKQ